jgi:SAM-dependent methyltransferase
MTIIGTEVGELSNGWKTRVAANRRSMDVELAGQPSARKTLSPALFGLTDSLIPRLMDRSHGWFLDAGCGTQPFRALVEAQVTEYLTYDRETRGSELDFIGDVEDMKAVPDRDIDTLLCSEVLEHVAHPDKAVSEFARIVKPGGTLLLTVPFLARLHEEPHDYFRYSRHGLRRLLEEAGFDVDEIVETGSLFSFLGHQVSLALLGLTWHRPRLRRLAGVVNSALVVRPCVAMDRLTGIARLLPLGYVVVATRAADG